MYIYEYERVSNNMSGWGLFNGNVYGSDGHREIIDERARQGWRFVCYVPAIQRGTGHIEEMDLVFEKNID